MRRIVSVFSSKRDKQDPRTVSTSHPVSTSPSRKRAHVLNVDLSYLPTNSATLDYFNPPTPQLSAGSGPSQSSASSTGSASFSLQTPEDEPIGLDRTPTKGKQWMSWLGKRAGTIKAKRPNRNETLDFSPPTPRRSPISTHVSPRLADKADGETSEEETEEDDFGSPAPMSHPPSAATAATIRSFSGSGSTAHAALNLANRIRNNLRLRPSVPPCVNSVTPCYPRTSNKRRTLPYPDTLHSLTLKRHLLVRLQNTENSSLSPLEASSILPFSSRPSPPLLPFYPDPVDEVYPPKTWNLSPFSEGLRRWMSRPCFEDRFLVWLPDDGGGLVCQRVSGTKFGVAALEYSESLEAMVDFSLPFTSPSKDETIVSPVGLDPERPPKDPNPSPSSSSSYLLTTSRYQAAHSTVPSPLRNEHDPSSVAAGDTADPEPEPPSSPTAVKRGVRFADDDKDDMIPIGYILRKRKHVEQKAKFLREQQERRQFEAERARVEEERRKRHTERMEWERERQAWEKEKEAAEKERKQRLYVEEVAASRLRRETQRKGAANRTSVADSNATSFTSLRDLSVEREQEQQARNEPRISRPLYDALPRRQNSNVGASSSSGSRSSPSASPASSRPESFTSCSSPQNGNNTISPLAQSNSRTPSMYSQTFSSSENVSGKRHSTASAGRSSDRSSSYPTFSSFSGSNQSLLLPPVPLMPGMPGVSGSAMPGFMAPFPLDMPLLPPSAPFMMGQHPRSKSQNSLSSRRGSSSSSPSRHGFNSNHSNSSSERVNMHNERHSSPHRSDRNAGASSSPSRRPTHERRSSGGSDRRQSGLHSQHYPDDRGRPHPSPSSSRSQPSSLSRGRPVQSTSVPVQRHTYTPSPWTSLAHDWSTTSGVRHPSTSEKHSAKTHPTRRQTTVT